MTPTRKASLAILITGLALSVAGATRFPAPPPFLDSGFPSEPDARLFVERLIGTVPAAVASSTLVSEPDLVPFVLRPLGMMLVEVEGDLRREIEEYAIAMARSAAGRLSQKTEWSQEELDALLRFQLLDPVRFVGEEPFRRRVLELLPRMMGGASARLRDRQLFELNQLRNFDYEASEAVEWGWKAIPRRSGEREIPWNSDSLAIPDDFSGPIETSVYSLNSAFVSGEEAVAFLRAVRAASPRRTIVVLGDELLYAGIRSDLDELCVHFVDTHGRRFTPWPRDPLTFSREGDRIVLIARPNVQRKREEDAHLARELVQGLPDELDRKWGGVRWTTAPVPFHNGQVLVTPGAVWISVHSLEGRILELLGAERMPVESFSTEAGLGAFWDAAERAAFELGSFYGRASRLVHSRPAGELRERIRGLDLLTGGAGFDLDSLVTLVPAPDGGLRALVGDLTLGSEALSEIPADEWKRFGALYGVAPASEGLASRLGRYQRSTRAARLDGFLDLVADHLASEGIEVRRLPLLLVPTSVLEDATDLTHPDFLVTWNNVVLEEGGSKPRAEGFSSDLPTLDERVRREFAGAGIELVYFPPLRKSVILNGGYRCASNHSRPAPDVKQ